jgi:gamma-glutamyltranspeptidase / glutathione hydrolase
MRGPIHSSKAMVATSEPHAAKAGKLIFEQGGNAVDAAIATAIALTVTESPSNGIGSDAFAMVSVGDEMFGLSSSGKSPMSLSYETFSARGQVPRYGFKPITVPGAVKLWKTLHTRFGTLPFERLFEPAIRLASDGFLIAPTVKKSMEHAKSIYQKVLTDEIHQPFLDTFFKQNLDQLYTLKDHAKTLAEIAQDPGGFYTGDLMRQMVTYFEKHGGYLKAEDFMAHEALWQTPLSVEAYGAKLFELPPNGQGMVALKALSIYTHTHDTLHHEIESIKRAFVSGKSVMYGEMSPSEIEGYLNIEHSMLEALKITDVAEDFTDPFLEDHGTVYLATGDLNMQVSLIQSNYMGYGSGIVMPRTGIAFQNRGANFLLKHHPNQYAPGKRPYHTLMPGFIKTPEGSGPLGVMGGFMQPQGHYQVFLNHLQKGMNIQEALDAPRYHYDKGLKLDVEPDFDPSSMEALIKAGHEVHVSDQVGLFGRGQIILRTKEGLLGATEKRCDGTIEGL